MIRVVLLVLLMMTPGCLATEETIDDELILATTTSMRDSGLLDVLLNAFEKESGISVHVVAVGTGAALNLGEKGDADILIVHAPDQEEEFIEDGLGQSRTTFAWNRFVLVGPTTMDSHVDSASAFSSLNGECFISRGDGSGTHIKEQEIWDSIGLTPDWDDYLSIGQGMASTLNMAHELQCWTISDMGTWLFRSSDLDLVATTWGDEYTLNPYSIIQLPDGPPEAHDLERYILSDEGQRIISSHTINDQNLFNTGQPIHEPSNNS